MASNTSLGKSILIVFGVGLLVLALRWNSISNLINGDKFPEPKFAWQHHWSEAETQAKSDGKPLLVVFSASWCPPCKTMKRNVWPDARVGEIVSSSYVPLYVDVDLPEHAEKCSKYGVSAIPFVVVLDQEGKVLRQANYMSASEAAEFLTAK